MSGQVFPLLSLDLLYTACFWMQLYIRLDIAFHVLAVFLDLMIHLE